MRDQEAICELVWHAGHTDWFDFKRGTRLAFFRYPKLHRRLARDGVPVWIENPDIPCTPPKRSQTLSATERGKVEEKVAKVIHRKFVLRSKGGTDIKSYLFCFAVPKGDDDVRMVYDATGNGLNACVWVPTFWLPTSATLLRDLDSDSWMTDRDMADMFLAYELDPRIRPYTGVDLEHLLGPSAPGDPPLDPGFWSRCCMGFVGSPYCAVRMSLIAQEVVRGDRHDTRLAPAVPGRPPTEMNPFQWETVHLNLPGEPGYDPRVSRITKRRKDGKIACDLFTFVDDGRPTGPSQELAWQASHCMASKQHYLGEMDAARKARPCSQTPGAWAGTVVHIHEGIGVCALASEEKWNRLKDIVGKWKERLARGDTELDHKELSSDRGFMVYATQPYPVMVPYLKGFHLSVEMWRGGRDPEGYRLKPPGEEGEDCSSVGSLDSMASLEEAARVDHHTPDRAAAQVRHAPENGLTTAVPRFRTDLEALEALSTSHLPPPARRATLAQRSRLLRLRGRLGDPVRRDKDRGSPRATGWGGRPPGRSQVQGGRLERGRAEGELQLPGAPKSGGIRRGRSQGGQVGPL